MAEILWVGFYGAATGNDTAQLARSIATVANAILPVSAFHSAPVASGLAIHMLAAVVLGVALAFAWRALSPRHLVGQDSYWFLPAALAVIWGLNFFVLLPLIGSDFVDLHRSFTEIVPYSTSLISKLLFGIAAAAVLTRKIRAQSVLVQA
jgi:hypothetical protein